ncbi:hypothetical protein C6Y45_04085 [Alkalicoccus saliphilus]|uniref:Uncharacterized protein n=1 Tax=Alkalicoccus saliphilus TaxID=200989 RepID=A0A2T4U8W8_9BACI|nr:hypothetical protein C6Y45_04085 [Alkalicoccus saliphilus]
MEKIFGQAAPYPPMISFKKRGFTQPKETNVDWFRFWLLSILQKRKTHWLFSSSFITQEAPTARRSTLETDTPE